VAWQAAADVEPGKHERCGAEARPVGAEVRIVAAVDVQTQRPEGTGAEWVLGERSEPLDAADEVGVDVRLQDQHGGATNDSEGLHAQGVIGLDRRELAHQPMNTPSPRVSASGAPPCRPIQANAAVQALR
jgi:hypothetical protein